MDNQINRSREQMERLQKELREEINPGWVRQLRDHYRSLHIGGPVRRTAREIVEVAMGLDKLNQYPKKGKTSANKAAAKTGGEQGKAQAAVEERAATVAASGPVPGAEKTEPAG